MIYFTVALALSVGSGQSDVLQNVEDVSIQASSQTSAIELSVTHEAILLTEPVFTLPAMSATHYAQGAAGLPAIAEDLNRTSNARTDSDSENRQSKAPTFEIALPLLLENRYLGDMTVRVSGDVLSFSLTRVLRLLGTEFTPDTLQEFKNNAIDNRLTIGQIGVSNVDVSYNRLQQQIEIVALNDARTVKVLQYAFQSNETKSIVVEPSTVSLFITPTVTSEYVWQSDVEGRNGFESTTGNIDFGGRIGGENGFAFLSRQSFSSEDERSFVRDETQFIYDRRDQTLRFTAGDLTPRGAAFQSIPGLAGFSVERFFELEPDRLFRPVAKSAFALERSSTVEVRINGVVQRELFLAAGRYDLRDLPLVQGANFVDLVIRDETGQEQIISNRNFFDFNLLQQGVTDFSISGGVKSQFIGGRIDYSSAAIATGFFRYGINSELTAGAHLQADEHGANGGVSALWASPVGVWRMEASASDRDTFGSGYALDVGYRATGGSGRDTWRWSADANAQLFGENFAVVTDQPFDGDRNALSIRSLRPNEAILNTSFQMSKNKLAMNAAATYSVGRAEARDRASGILGATFAVSPRLSAGFFGRYTDDGLDSDYGINFQLTWRLASNRTLRADYDSIDEDSSFRYRKSANRSVGNIAYGVEAINDFERDEFSLTNGNFSYIGNRFELNSSHSISRNISPGSQDSQTTRTTVASSLVYSDGKVALARPVRDSFAIVTQHKSLKGSEILVAPGRKGYSAKTDFMGDAVGVDVVAYTRQSLVVDVTDLPLGYDLGAGEFILRPPLFSGYNLTVGSNKSFTLIGSLVDASSGTALAYLGGQLKSLDNPELEPIPAFSNRNGRLAAIGVGPGRYKLVIFDVPSFDMVIKIGEESSNLIELGVIALELP